MFLMWRKKLLESNLPFNQARLLMTTDTIQEVAVSVWSVDPTHSAVHFKVRHMGIAWVRGDFRILKGTLQWDEGKISESSIDVDIDAASVYSNEPKRDEHLRNADLLDVERFPSMHFRSTRVSRSSVDSALVAGELTIHGVTRPVELRVTEISPATKDPWGNIRFAASATTKISRKEFGLTWNPLLETGGVLVGDEVFIDLDVEFIRPAK
jgi:polyisoprenoid-binding protein YceI